MPQNKNLSSLITELNELYFASSHLPLSNDIILKLNKKIDLILNLIDSTPELDIRETNHYIKSFRDFLVNYTSILEKYKLNIKKQLLEIDTHANAFNAYNNVLNYNIK
ncbi:hypothetical protein NOVO_08990 [Rickettsiales bacterium Ac37b]|nr:hypothetical protein NOVO_08990 [Rickettsiales bacterium Ac37b]